MSARGALHIPTMKRSASAGGSFLPRVPCKPETSVGRRSARGMMTSSPFGVDDYSLFCKLCDRRMDDRIIYMYMSMGFCTEECRTEYFLEYRYRLAMAMEPKRRRARSEAMKTPVSEGEAAIGYRSIFFVCAEVESIPFRLSLKQPYLLGAW